MHSESISISEHLWRRKMEYIKKFKIIGKRQRNIEWDYEKEKIDSGPALGWK